MPTVEESVRFIRHYGLLKDWSDAQIINQILKCIQQNSMAYCVDENQKLISICLASWHDSCSMHIIALAGIKGSLERMLGHLKTKYPTIKYLTATRRTKPVTYNVEKLYVRSCSSSFK